MCGRYTLFTLSDFLRMFPWILPPDIPAGPRYNIAPTQPVLAAVNRGEGAKLEYLHWGLVPGWASDSSMGQRMINARAETLAEKPAFKGPLRKRRCLIPADGFYEWRKNADGTKTPMHIQMKDERPFAMAGLWEEWRGPDDVTLPSCTIITTAPNELVGTIHDRMPCIVPADRYETWLRQGELAAGEVKEVLGAFPAEEMKVTPVSTRLETERVVREAPWRKR